MQQNNKVTDKQMKKEEEKPKQKEDIQTGFFSKIKESETKNPILKLPEELREKINYIGDLNETPDHKYLIINASENDTYNAMIIAAKLDDIINPYVDPDSVKFVNITLSKGSYLAISGRERFYVKTYGDEIYLFDVEKFYETGNTYIPESVKVESNFYYGIQEIEDYLITYCSGKVFLYNREKFFNTKKGEIAKEEKILNINTRNLILYKNPDNGEEFFISGCEHLEVHKKDDFLKGKNEPLKTIKFEKDIFRFHYIEETQRIICNLFTSLGYSVDIKKMIEFEGKEIPTEENSDILAKGEEKLSNYFGETSKFFITSLDTYFNCCFFDKKSHLDSNQSSIQFQIPNNHMIISSGDFLILMEKKKCEFKVINLDLINFQDDPGKKTVKGKSMKFKQVMKNDETEKIYGLKNGDYKYLHSVKFISEGENFELDKSICQYKQYCNPDIILEDENFIYLRAFEDGFRVFDKNTEKSEPAIIALSPKTVTSIAQDSNYIFSIGYDGGLKIWRKEDFKNALNYLKSLGKTTNENENLKDDFKIVDGIINLETPYKIIKKIEGYDIALTKEHIHIFGYSTHTVYKISEVLEGKSRIVKKNKTKDRKKVRRGYLLTKACLYKITEDDINLIIEENEDNFEFDAFDIYPKKEMAIIHNNKSGSNYFYDISFAAPKKDPIIIIESEKRDKNSVELLLDKYLTLTNGNGDCIVSDISEIGNISLLKLASKDALLSFSIFSLGSEIEEMEEKITFDDVDKRLKVLIHQLNRCYPKIDIMSSELLNLIILYSSNPEVLHLYLDTVGFSFQKDQFKEVLRIAENSNDRVRQNFINMIKYAKEKNYPYLLRFMENETFYKILKYNNFINQDIVAFGLNYLKQEIGEYEGEVRANHSIFDFRDKLDTIKVDKEQLKEIQGKKIFKDRDNASQIQNFSVNSTGVRLSYKSGTKINRTLFEFFGRLRDDQIISMEPLIQHKFVKIKWFHMLCFVLFAIYAYCFNNQMFTSEFKESTFWISIVLNIFFILFEIITFRDLGGKNYFSSKVNFFDPILLVSSIVMLVWNRIEKANSDKQWVNYTLGIAALIVSYVINVRCIIYMRFINGLRPIIQSIEAIMTKILYFILLMISYIFVVIGTLYAKERLDVVRGVEGFKKMEFNEKLGYSIKLSFGDIAFPEADSFNQNWVDWIILIPNGLIVVIMLLNLLIGILSNVFDEFQQSCRAFDLRVQLSMIKEADSFFSIFSTKGN